MSVKLKSQLKAVFLLLLLGTIWGSGYSIARYATTHGVLPLGYAFWQSLGPTVFMFFMINITNRKFSLLQNHFAFYFICGLIGIVLPNSNMYIAAPHLPAGLLAVLVNTVPLMTYAMMLGTGGERFNLVRFLGILLGFLGILSLVVPKTSLPNASLVPWILTTLITPFCFACCAIYIAKKQPQNTDANTLAAGMLLIATLLLLPIVVLSKQFYFFKIPFTRVEWLMLLEMVLSSMGYVLFFKLLKYAGPVYYSMVGGIVMLTGLFWGWLVFGETLNVWTSISLFLILTGVYLVTLKQVKQY